MKQGGFRLASVNQFDVKPYVFSICFRYNYSKKENAESCISTILNSCLYNPQVANYEPDHQMQE